MPANLLDRRQLLLGAGLIALGAVATAATRIGVRAFDENPDADGEPTQLRLATGPQGGVFRAIGGKIMEVLVERFPRAHPTEIPTGASVDNLALLASGGTELALAYLDATVAGLAVGQPSDVTAVARLYDAWMHVIVPASSPLRAFVDLDGRTITAGATGSGTRMTSGRLFEVANIRPTVIDASQSDGAKLLAAGQVDAMLTLTGIPTPAVTNLAKDVRLRMIPLHAYTEALEIRYGDFYAPSILPSSMYPGVDGVETLTIPSLLLARPDLPASMIEKVTSALFEERDRIARGFPGANQINVRTAIATAPVRLHPGAMDYFRSQKR
jgi:TRAP transporter TAXI family solute receptor